MSRAVVLLITFVALASPAAAAAVPGPLAHETDPATGDGLLLVGSYSPSAGPLTWEQCLPGGACAPFDDGDGNEMRLAVGDPPAGTTYRVTQGATTLTSEPWQGRLHRIMGPTYTGDLRVGSRVAPMLGAWSRGWGVEKAHLQLQACPDPVAANGCVVIYDTLLLGPCSSGQGRVLAARDAGKWLRVAEDLSSQRLPMPAVGYPQPEVVTPLAANARVAVTLAGRIEPGGPDGGPCIGGSYVDPGFPWPDPGYRDPGYVDPGPDAKAAGRKPKVALPKQIAWHKRKGFVAAKVTCPARCRLDLRVTQGRRGVTVRRTLKRGTTSVALPAVKVRRVLRSGKVRVRVKVGSAVVANRVVTLRR